MGRSGTLGKNFPERQEMGWIDDIINCLKSKLSLLLYYEAFDALI